MTGSTPIVPQNPDYKGGMRVGRFPANLIISDDPAVIDCFPPDKSKFFKSIIYTAKAGTKERSAESNNHPTVKPLELMRYLVKLVTLPGGIVLDPFCGSGSTCIAAKLEGFRFVGIEINPDYADTARRRVA
jgi:site-specific DNA-methyltransferase (adenine-specific)